MAEAPTREYYFNPQRECARVHLPISAAVSAFSHNQFENLAVLRDISTSGAFFFCDSPLETGSDVCLQFILSVLGRDIHVTCSGTVVRVEEPRESGKGIAMRFLSCDLRELQ